MSLTDKLADAERAYRDEHALPEIYPTRYIGADGDEIYTGRLVAAFEREVFRIARPPYSDEVRTAYVFTFDDGAGVVRARGRFAALTDMEVVRIAELVIPREVLWNERERRLAFDFDEILAALRGITFTVEARRVPTKRNPESFYIVHKWSR